MSLRAKRGNLVANNLSTHDKLKEVVMLRNEASSSPCIAALHIEEDSSLSLRMTKRIGSIVLATILLQHNPFSPSLHFNLKRFGDHQ
jgi:hypothetical protein